MWRENFHNDQKGKYNVFLITMKLYLGETFVAKFYTLFNDFSNYRDFLIFMIFNDIFL